MSTTTLPHAPHDTRRASFGAMTLGAIGVVFGDIGTSPLYTIKEAFSPHYGLTPDTATVLGILSLIFWTLVIVITVKYVAVIMRVDNNGEGGIMALTALAQRTLAKTSRAALSRRHPRRVRRGAVLRRWRADAGDLGALARWKACRWRRPRFALGLAAHRRACWWCCSRRSVSAPTAWARPSAR